MIGATRRNRRTSYAFARDTFAALCDEVASSGEAVVIKRRGQSPVALIAADELSSLMETVYLMSNPANARALLDALARADAGDGTPMTMAELRVTTGFDEAPR